jgi:hypothetical protein
LSVDTARPATGASGSSKHSFRSSRSSGCHPNFQLEKVVLVPADDHASGGPVGVERISREERHLRIPCEVPHDRPPGQHALEVELAAARLPEVEDAGERLEGGAHEVLEVDRPRTIRQRELRGLPPRRGLPSAGSVGSSQNQLCNEPGGRGTGLEKVAAG